MAPEIMFNFFVVLAFLTSFADHWYVGRGRINRPLRAFLLGCFVYTESYLAITVAPALWFYVALNFWGMANLFFGQRVPLPGVWLQRRFKRGDDEST